MPKLNQNSRILKTKWKMKINQNKLKNKSNYSKICKQKIRSNNNNSNKQKIMIFYKLMKIIWIMKKINKMSLMKMNNKNYNNKHN